MKKLSIFLALVMALSCFGITAFAADESSTAAPADVIVTVKWQNLEGSKLEPKADVVLKYQAAPGGTLTADDVIKAVKVRLDDDGNKLVDAEEYVISETVHGYDANGKYEFKSVKVEEGAEYKFDVYAVEINDVEVFASVLADEAASIPWGDIASANVTLINQIINGFKAAINSLTSNLPEKEVKTEEEVAEPTTAEAEEVETTPDTGASAVAGAAVVVLALSAATAVVLRKKED